MTAYLLFAAGYVAGTVIKQRDLPLAAIGLGLVLLLAGNELGIFNH